MGDKNKICKDWNDPSFAKLLRDMEKGKVNKNLSSFYTRPVYAYTKAKVGDIGDELPNV